MSAVKVEMTEISWRAGKGKKVTIFERNAFESIAKSQSEGGAVAQQTEDLVYPSGVGGRATSSPNTR